jgi:DNA invertase Pin-like site-specific DNA recombinase
MASARKRGRMPGRAPKLTAKKLAVIRARIKDGWTVAECAKDFRVSDNAIYRYFPSAELEKIRNEK